jgi:ankyrin repeat protein
MSIVLSVRSKGESDQKSSVLRIDEKIKAISAFISPLTLPSIDTHGNKIQLWSVPDCKVMASVQDKSGKVTYIPSSKIYNGIDPSMDSVTLHSRLLGSALVVWDLVLRTNGTLSIWPHLIAGAWKHVIPRPGGDLTSFTRLAQRMSQSEMCSWFYANNFRCQSTNKMTVDVMVDGAHVGNFHPVRDHDAIRTMIMSQHGSRVKLSLKPDPYQAAEGAFAGRGMVFSHPKDRSHATFNIDCTIVEGGVREKAGGYHIDVKSDHLLVKGKVSTKETYELNREARAQGRALPFDVLPKADTLKLAPHNDPSKHRFKLLLDQANLVESYNSLHPDNPILSNVYQHGDIGGVACSASYIEDLFQGTEGLFCDSHYFALPTFDDGSMPFSNAQLKQILRELTVGIYAHGQVPFFSLHFQHAGLDLYPIIHPVYQNTLVGRVIGLLDYMMKGYLNGGVYQQEFIDTWQENPDWAAREATALEQLIDFEAYCKEKMPPGHRDYSPLSSRLPTVPEDDDSPEILKSFEGFRNSFRIIAKQNLIEKHEDLFMINADFDVFYDIAPTPEYQIALDAYMRQKGSLPTYYTNMETWYQCTAQMIHDHMTMMPLCKKYFKMLGTISFFASYLTTLKKHRKEPMLKVMQRLNIPSVPVLFPHLPIKDRKKIELFCNLKTLFENLYREKKADLSSFSKELFVDFSKESEGPLTAALKTRLNSFLVLRAKDVMWERLGFIGQRAFDSKEDLAEMSEKIATKLLNGFATIARIAYQRFCSASPGFDVASIKIDKFIELYIGMLEEDGDEKVAETTRPINLFPHELSVEKRNKLHKFVGGCAVKLEVLKPQTTLRSQAFFKEHRAIMSELEAEELTPLLDSAGKQQAVFALSIQDIPPGIDDNYIWTESLLAKEESPLWALFHEVKKYMSQNQKEAVTALLEDMPPELKTITDFYERTLLHYAVSLNEPYYVNLLVDKGFSLKDKDQAGLMPIHFAAVGGNLDILNKVYFAGAENQIGKNSERPLTLAILSKNIPACDFFLKKGALITTTIGGYTDIHAAAYVNHKDILSMIMEHPQFSEFVNTHSLEGGTALMSACEHADLESITAMISKGANPAIGSPSGVTCHEIVAQRNALGIATFLLGCCEPSLRTLKIIAEKGSLEMAELYKERLYRLDDPSGDTAIHIALKFGNCKAALMLIRDCALAPLLRQLNIELQSIMELACLLGDTAIIQALLDKGISLDLKSAILLTHLPYSKVLKDWILAAGFDAVSMKKLFSESARTGHFKLCQEVFLPLKANSQLDVLDDGWTFLHYLAKFDNILLLRKLTESLENFDLKTEGAKTYSLAGVAARYGSAHVLSYLLTKQIDRKGAYPNKHLLALAIESGVQDLLIESCYKEPMNAEGLFAIHVAAASGNLACIERLLELGADVNKKDTRGLAAIDHAIVYQRDDVISALSRKYHCHISVETLILAASSSLKCLKILYESQDLRALKATAMAQAVAARNAKLQNSLNLNPVFEPIQTKLTELTQAFVVNSVAVATAIINTMPYEDLIDASIFEVMRLANKLESFIQILIERLSREPTDLNRLNMSGRTLFSEAILGKAHTLISFMLDKGVLLDKIDSEFLNPLAYACEAKDLNIFKLLLTKGADPFIKVSKKGVSIVDMAIDQEFCEGVKYLLTTQAHIDRLDLNRLKLIHLIIKEGSEANLRFMISRGISPFEKVAEDYDVRHMAASEGNLPILKLLIELQGHPLTQEEGQVIMKYAILREKIDIVKWLLDQGVEPFDIDEGNPLKIASSRRLGRQFIRLFEKYKIIESPEALKSALMVAIGVDSVETCRKLFSYGIGFDDDLKMGYNSLQIAIKNESVAAINYLLSESVSLDVIDHESKSVFELAAEAENSMCLKSICDVAQVDINQKYIGGQTLVHTAVKAKRLTNIIYLISEGADVNIVDIQGCTPLHRACEIGDIDAIKLLLVFGADLDIASNLGKKPFDLLPEEHEELKAFFLELHPKVAGDTSLHLAVKWDALQAVDYLLKTLTQAELSSKNSQNKTAKQILTSLAARLEMKKLFDSRGL